MKDNTYFAELKKSVIYAYESKIGKYSLDTYLKILGNFTDRAIMQAEGDGLKFINGFCKFEKSKKTDENVLIMIKMYFENSSKKYIEKEAKREINKKKFTRGAIKKFETQALNFNIESPKKGC